MKERENWLERRNMNECMASNYYYPSVVDLQMDRKLLIGQII